LVESSPIILSNKPIAHPLDIESKT